MRTLSLLALLLLAGCSTMNKPECQTASLNPSALGLSDGQKGYGLWRLDKHVESCARFGIDIDRQAYLAARERGLQDYCTPENAERVGMRGETYEDVCPTALAPAFLERYYPAYRESTNNR